MRVTVLGFATVTDALGAESLQVELADGSRLAELKRRLDRDHPDLEPLWPRLAVAVDGALVRGDDAELRDGAEVALLPPVSGGAPEASGPPCPALVDGPLDLAAAVAAVASPRRGAVLVFTGTVRDHHQGRPVTALTYSAYRSMAEDRIATLCRELSDPGDDLAVALSHRLGRVEAGEPSVVIAVASPHREAAYRANRRALERLKAEVPIWKREHYADGTAAWREEEPLRAS